MISKIMTYSVNFSGRNVKAKKHQSKPIINKKTVAVAATIAVGTATFLSYKGVFGPKAQNYVNSMISNVKSLFSNNEKNSVKPEKAPVIQNNKIPDNVVVTPLNRISDLNNRANSLRQELISITSGEDGLEEMLSKLYCVTEVNQDTVNEIVKITSKANRLENIIIDYNNVMEENNSLVDKLKNGRTIRDIAQKQYYINLIQRANQLQEVLEYDEKGVSVSSDALQNLIASWMQMY